MKKISTPTLGSEPAKRDDCHTLAPRTSTIAFLRQFARAYRPAPAPSMPGFVLN